MSDKVEISNIVFKIGDKEIELTLSEAKKLQDLLNSNFFSYRAYDGVWPVIIEKHIPHYLEPYRWNDWEITWSGKDNCTQPADDRSGGTLYCSC